MKRIAYILIICFVVFAMAETSSADPGTYETALEKYYHHDYHEAVLFLKAAVEKKPDPAAYYLLGYSLYKLKRFDEANEYFKDAYLIDPTFSPEKAELFQDFPKAEIRKMKKASHRASVKVKKDRSGIPKAVSSERHAKRPAEAEPIKETSNSTKTPAKQR